MPASFREPISQLIILALIMMSLIVVVFLVFIYRFTLFGPSNLSEYGSYGEKQLSSCEVPGKSLTSTRCTETGVQVAVAQCIPNPVTGYLCYDEAKKEQTAASQVSVTSCLPACMSFLWAQSGTTPCLLDDGIPVVNGETFRYKSSTEQWCHQNTNGTRFRIWECQRRDGSGLNMCTYTCDGNSSNIDCYKDPYTQYSTGTTLMYNPILTPRDSSLDLEYKDGVYTYTPLSKAKIAFPVIAADVMVTKEACTDLEGYTCGFWRPSAGGVPIPDNNSQQLTSDCSVLPNIFDAFRIGYQGGTRAYNYAPGSINTVYDLFEPGLQERSLDCFDEQGAPAPRCEPEPAGCVAAANIFSSSGSGNNILSLVKTGAAVPQRICGLSTKNSEGTVLSVTKNASTLNACVYVQTNFSATPNTNLIPTPEKPAIEPDVFVFDNSLGAVSSITGLFGVPLFIKRTVLATDYYLTLFNNPCPSYTVTDYFDGNIFTFNSDGKFIEGGIDPIPSSGLPFRFDCKGDPYATIMPTPAVWLEDVQIDPASAYGISAACNLRTNNISPIIEQTALYVMLRPAKLAPNEVLAPKTVKCNIFAVFGSNYIGWLTWQDTIAGYAGGSAANKHILTWVQGRFDPYGDAAPGPGQRIGELNNANFYLTRLRDDDYTYSLTGAPDSDTIDVFDSLDNSLNPITEITFVRATSQGQAVVNNSNVIQESTFADFLYSRQNRGDNPSFALPACNINLVQV